MSIDYGLGGLVNAVTRFDGTVVSNAYDNRGRLATQVLPDVTNRLHYLANGLTSVLSNGASSATFSYDTLNRPTSVTVSNTFVPFVSFVVYAYDPAGNVTQAVTTAGTTRFRYDAGERLTNMVRVLGTRTNELRYGFNSWNGGVATERHGNGLWTEYLYDLLDRPTSIVYRTAASNTIYSLAYQYDTAGMITQKSIQGPGVSQVDNSSRRFTG